MKRFNHSIYVVSGLFAMVLVGGPALATPVFSNSDLKGEYLCTGNEVHQLFDGPVQYCVFAASGNFDGSGMVGLNSTARCSITGIRSGTGSQFYSVNPDGSFLISESPGMTDPVHGQIVEHGRTLLLDGTLRTLSEILSWSGVCMQR